jgi:3-isopropylmalate dehydratase small subunit
VESLLSVAADHIICVDLEHQTVTSSAGHQFNFAMDDFRRECLIGGLDEIAITLLHEPDIRAYELRTGI